MLIAVLMATILALLFVIAYQYDIIVKLKKDIKDMFRN